MRKAPQLRPPAYALPALPIAPDPQPLPLAASTPAQPLNPAQGGGRPPAPGITIPAMRVAPIQPFTIEARPTFVAPGQMIQSGAPAGMNVSGLRQATPQNAFLNPEILQYFNADANGTYRSRIRLDANSLFTLPSMNPLLQRSGSTTYKSNENCSANPVDARQRGIAHAAETPVPESTDCLTGIPTPLENTA